MDYVTFDKLCKERGTTATALALKLGLSKGNTNSWRKGGNPSAEVLVRIADELNCTVDALLGRQFSFNNLSDEERELLKLFRELSDRDRGRIIEKAETLSELAAERTVTNDNKYIALPVFVKSNDDDTVDINFYDMPSSAGTGAFLDHSYYERRKVRHTPEAEQADFAIPIVGDSMEPDFHSGDIVFVQSCPYVKIGEVGIFVLDGDAYIKKYDGNQLISLNPAYPPLKLSNYETAVCLGRVLGVAELMD